LSILPKENEIQPLPGQEEVVANRYPLRCGAKFLNLDTTPVVLERIVGDEQIRGALQQALYLQGGRCATPHPIADEVNIADQSSRPDPYDTVRYVIVTQHDAARGGGGRASASPILQNAVTSQDFFEKTGVQRGGEALPGDALLGRMSL